MTNGNLSIDPKISASSSNDQNGGAGFAWKTISLIEKTTTFSGAVAACMLVAIGSLMLLEIVWRFILDRGLHFTWEYSGYAMAGTFLLGASYALSCGTHVRVTALLEIVPAEISRRLDWVCTVIGLIISIFIAFALAKLAMTSWKHDVVSFTVNHVPLVYPQILMTIGATLLAMQFLARLIRLSIGAAPETVPSDDELPTGKA